MSQFFTETNYFYFPFIYALLSNGPLSLNLEREHICNGTLGTPPTINHQPSIDFMIQRFLFNCMQKDVVPTEAIDDYRGIMTKLIIETRQTSIEKGVERRD